MRAASIAGPCFVSIGNAEKLQVFLDNNPKIDREYTIVDDYNLKAYDALGFGNIADDKEKTIEGSKKIKAPNFSAGDWFKYFRAVGSLMPTDKPFKFGEIPLGAVKLGGTFAIDSDEVLFSYEDGVPGDYPDPRVVLAALGLNTKAK